MAIRTTCPHCQSPCMVNEQHLGGTVQCFKCGQPFSVRTEGATPLSWSPVPTDPHGACRLEIGSATSTGKLRDRNEDSFLVQQFTWSHLDQRHEIALVVVADGMGGHGAGDQASGIGVRTVNTALAPLLGGAITGQFKEVPSSTLVETLDYAMQEANRAVFRKGQSDPACKGMGATAATALIWDGRAIISHVGDCRVYHLHGGKLNQVTRDQTLVERLVELGQLSPREALTHPARNEVQHALGKRFETEPSRHERKLSPGDWLVVACDGLHAHVDYKSLEDLLVKSPASAAHVAHALVDRANEGGGSDNCSVVVVRVY